LNLNAGFELRDFSRVSLAPAKHFARIWDVTIWFSENEGPVRGLSWCFQYDGTALTSRGVELTGIEPVTSGLQSQRSPD
jgi:hypothetical protein